MIAAAVAATASVTAIAAIAHTGPYAWIRGRPSPVGSGRVRHARLRRPVRTQRPQGMIERARNMVVG